MRAAPLKPRSRNNASQRRSAQVRRAIDSPTVSANTFRDGELSRTVLRVKIIALVMLTLVGTSGVARAASVTPGTPAEAQCKSLPGTDFSGISDASTQVTDAKVAEAAAGAPAYCKVQGYVSPQVGFELRLPLSNWNGKFMEFGTKVKKTICLQFSEVILIDLLEGRKI